MPSSPGSLLLTRTLRPLRSRWPPPPPTRQHRLPKQVSEGRAAMTSASQYQQFERRPVFTADCEPGYGSFLHTPGFQPPANQRAAAFAIKPDLCNTGGPCGLAAANSAHGLRGEALARSAAQSESDRGDWSAIKRNSCARPLQQDLRSKSHSHPSIARLLRELDWKRARCLRRDGRPLQRCPFPPNTPLARASEPQAARVLTVLHHGNRGTFGNYGNCGNCEVPLVASSP